MDPLLDDSVAMAKKLQRLGNSVGLDVLSGLPHGFLMMIHVRISYFYKYLSKVPNRCLHLYQCRMLPTLSTNFLYSLLQTHRMSTQT